VRGKADIGWARHRAGRKRRYRVRDDRSTIEMTRKGNVSGNLLADLPTSLPEELVQVLLTSPGLRAERIVSVGHASPEGFWYDQPEHEWVLLVAGAARLQFEGDPAAVEMRPGSYVNIPAGRRHRVDWTDPDRPTVWLAIHYSGRVGPGGIGPTKDGCT
jgi:cupin 2 domain-containing protein